MNDFKLILANMDYCQAVLDIVNDPEVRANSFSNKIISYDDHVVWYTKRLILSDAFYLAIDDDGLAGYARFEGEPKVISISLAARVRGKAYGIKLIVASCLASGYNLVNAYIFPHNVASIKTFTKAGFIDNGLMQYKGKTVHLFVWNRQEVLAELQH